MANFFIVLELKKVSKNNTVECRISCTNTVVKRAGITPGLHLASCHQSPGKVVVQGSCILQISRP